MEIMDPTQRRLIKRLTRLTFIQGMLFGLLLIDLALDVGTIWPHQIGDVFLPAPLEQLITSFEFFMLGFWFLISTEVTILRQQLHLSRRGPGSPDAVQAAPILAACGLFMIGLSVLMLLGDRLYPFFPDYAFLVAMIGWFVCSYFAARYFYRRRNRRVVQS